MLRKVESGGGGVETANAVPVEPQICDSLKKSGHPVYLGQSGHLISYQDTSLMRTLCLVGGSTVVRGNGLWTKTGGRASMSHPMIRKVSRGV